jgi:hypothetical protein
VHLRWPPSRPVQKRRPAGISLPLSTQSHTHLISCVRFIASRSQRRIVPSFDTVKAVASSADSARAVGLSRCALQKRPVPYLLLPAAAAGGCWGVTTLCASLRCNRPEDCRANDRGSNVYGGEGNSCKARQLIVEKNMPTFIHIKSLHRDPEPCCCCCCCCSVTGIGGWWIAPHAVSGWRGDCQYVSK